MDRLQRDRPGNRLVTRHRVTTCLRTCSRFPQVLSNETRTSQFTLTMITTNENFMKTILYTFYLNSTPESCPPCPYPSPSPIPPPVPLLRLPSFLHSPRSPA